MPQRRHFLVLAQKNVVDYLPDGCRLADDLLGWLSVRSLSLRALRLRGRLRLRLTLRLRLPLRVRRSRYTQTEGHSKNTALPPAHSSPPRFLQYASSKSIRTVA